MLFINRKIDDSWLVLQASETAEEFASNSNNGFVIKNGMVTHYAANIRLEDHISAQGLGREAEHARKTGKEINVEGHNITLIPFRTPLKLDTVVKANQALADALAKAGDDDAVRDKAGDAFHKTGCREVHNYVELDPNSTFAQAVEHVLRKLSPIPEEIHAPREIKISESQAAKPELGKWKSKEVRPKKPRQPWRGFGGESPPRPGEDSDEPPRGPGPRR